MKATHNRMAAGELHFYPFNRLKLKDVYVEDLNGDTLLYAGTLAARFDLFRLLKNELLIRSVDLAHFTVGMNREHSDSAFNFQFLVDAFASEKTDTASSGLAVRIHDITLREGRFRYDVRSEPALGDSLFDVNHLRISHLCSEIDLSSIDLKKPELTVRQLSFTGNGGLEVTRFQAAIRTEKEQVRLEDLRIELPHSRLHIPEGFVGTEEQKPLKIVLGKSRLRAADLKMFYPGLVYFRDDFTFSGEINGTLPRLNLSAFELNGGKHIRLKCNASIRDVNRWRNTPLELHLHRLSADSAGVGEVLRCFSDGNRTELPVRLGQLNLQGTLKGTLPHLLLQLVAQSESGTVRLDGTGGYDFDSVRFDATLLSDDFDVRTLLQDTLFGQAALQLHAKGQVGADGQVDAGGHLAVDRFDFKGYSYRRLRAAGRYTGDSLRLHLNSADENVKLKAHLLADAGGKSVKLKATAENIFLDPLHFLPGYKDVVLKTSLTAAVEGFDRERMQVDLSIDSFSLATDKGVFLEPHLQLAYRAEDGSGKRLNIDSGIMTVDASGQFTYSGLLESLKGTFPMLFPESKPDPAKKDRFAENLHFWVGMNHINSLSQLLDLPRALPDSILFIGKFSNNSDSLKLSTSAYTLFTESDTLQVSLLLSNKGNNLAAVFNVDNRSANYDLDGQVDAEVAFIPQPGRIVPDMHIVLNPTVFVLNETYFNLRPAQIEVKGDRYFIHNLSFHHDENPEEYVKADGIISPSAQDSLTVKVSQFQLETVFGAMKTSLSLQGVADGSIAARNLLAAPIVTSRRFTINQLRFAGNELGNLSISSGWSSERNGLILRAGLSREDHEQSLISGFVLPEKDSLSLSANIKDIELNWLQDRMKETLYGLDGTVDLRLKAQGRIKDPTVTGAVRFNRAQVGIKQLNTLYSTSDSIVFNSRSIDLKRFTLADENKHTFTLDGKITHRLFTGFNPDLSVSVSDFLVLNNERQADNLFYGTLRVNGLLKLKKHNKDWMLTGDMTHSNNSRVMVNIPSSTSTAERYSSITFINQAEDRPPAAPEAAGEKLSLPFKINVSLWLDPSLTVGAVFNPATQDAAHAAGNGMIKFSCDMNTSHISLLGDYEVERGQATLSLVNITKKTFKVQQGGKLVFRGDPLATTFDVTALYSLRANLATLDPSFESLNLTSTKVPVNCSLTATGNINKMDLKYRIELPNEQEDIQRKLNGLLYTDDLKIKEIAYLLAFGTFMPVNTGASQAGSSHIWTSLASSSITGQLNNLLSSVLNKNWSVGTNLHTGSAGAGDLDMDVNVSTRLLNDRLTINGTLNYRSDPNQLNNFTGDFNAEYKLIPSGNVVLKVFNTTNNQYYETAPTTQGFGVVYKRNARTFRKLFDKFRKK
ncbi:MAG: translocation/assembly module TamB [Dysgonamonadaceae bacterium]|nr:translocation/assembly module TamB [Dysgonamonadaceae bacterium]